MRGTACVPACCNLAGHMRHFCSTHVQYDPALAALPQQLTFRWGARTATVSGLVYQPRPEVEDAPWLADGRIGDYEVLVSTDGTTFESVADGAWADSGAAKTVTFSEQTDVQRVRLRCLTEVSGKSICNAAEVYIIGTYDGDAPPGGGGGGDGGGGGGNTTSPSPDTPPAGDDDVLDRDGWFAVPTSQQVRAGEYWPGAFALDGDDTTMWISQWIGDPVRGIGAEFFELPHSIDIVMGGAVNVVSGFVYLPRQGAPLLCAA